VGAEPVLASRTVVQGFEIQGVLRSGPRGAVYEAVQGSLLRPVALRLLAPELSRDPDFAQRFWQQRWPEHPHIVSVFEAGECEHGLFVAMQLIRGHTLAEVLARGALEHATAVTALTQVASALDAAHQDGLAHGWVRPEAILIDERGRAWLSDFGLVPGAASPAADRRAFGAIVRRCLGRRSVPRKGSGTSSELVAAAAARGNGASGSGSRQWRPRRPPLR
jgi:serine/threonine protein kinase